MSSIDPVEIAAFARHAHEWWDAQGPMRPLHKLNPARMEFLRDSICAHFNRKANGPAPLKNLSILDIGCGGGLLCEPLARLGATVTGLDAGKEAIEVARTHATLSGLTINYHNDSAEKFARGKTKFDVVTLLEIVEHVADIGSLLESASALLKPSGIVILSTLNRNTKSFLMGIVAAEYILRWVPKGTHSWRKFLRPSELAAHLQEAGLEVKDITGIVFNPLNDTFHLKSGAVSVNYLMTAVKCN
jgi:2-polyprenyl-6-hydroxyphenyl methylase/3-demethylubiquinone-9 3-methyltransferase